MRFIISFLSILLITVSAQAGGFRNIRLQAAGLTCSMCSNAINKALKTLPEVGSIDTDLKNNVFIISLKDGSSPDFDAIKNKVEGAGFSVANLTAEYEFEQVEVKKDEHLTLDNKLFHFVAIKPQTLSGWQTLQIVDENFVLEKSRKKIVQSSKMECVKTGKMAACCTADGQPSAGRVYHVTI